MHVRQAKNMVVAQSGGPSPVINNSLRGLVEAARDFPQIGTIYAGWHGIEGVLKEELLDLSAQPADEIALLRVTPAAGSIGTCRYKLRESQQEDFDRTDRSLQGPQRRLLLLHRRQRLDGHGQQGRPARPTNAGWIWSASACPRRSITTSATARSSSSTIRPATAARPAIGHTWCSSPTRRMPAAARPTRCWSCRRWAARSALSPPRPAWPIPHRELPLQIYLAERPVTLEQMADNVNGLLRRAGRAIVVVSEGLQVADIGEVKDSFGHTQFSSSQLTVAQAVINGLNARGLPVKGAARANVPGTDQRHNMIYASTVDLDEAYRVGPEGGRTRGRPARAATWPPSCASPGRSINVRYDKVPLAQVANSERTFPGELDQPDGHRRHTMISSATPGR